MSTRSCESVRHSFSLRAEKKGVRSAPLYCLVSTAIVGALLLTLNGCSTIGFSMAAAPLKPAAVCPAPSATSGTIDYTSCVPSNATPLDQVHDLVQDSETKCQAFITTLFARTASTNTSLDIASTSLSALATVFTPLSTVHALTAGSTIATGSKTSLQNEYLNTVTISHVIQAIQSSYGSDMQKYIKYLDGVTDHNSIDLVAERSTILTYHAECSLPAANGTIASSLQPSGAPKQQPGQLSLTYTVKATDSNATAIGSGILAQINADSTFDKLNIKAAEHTGGANGTITLTVPSSLTITWKHNQFVAGPGTAAPTESIAFQDGPPTTFTISVKGSTQAGDMVTIASVSLDQAAAAQPGSTETALPPPATGSQQLTTTYSVGRSDKTLAALALSISKKLASDPDFQRQGVKVSPGTPGTLVFSPPQGRTLAWTQNEFSSATGHATPGETVAYTTTPTPSLTFSGTPQTGDKIVLNMTLSDATTASTPPPKASSQSQPVLAPSAPKPPAAISGEAITQKF